MTNVQAGKIEELKSGFKGQVLLPGDGEYENARKIWEELELPKLRPQMPWFGYSLGQWSDELDNEAQLAVEGRHFETGEKLKQLRVKVR